MSRYRSVRTRRLNPERPADFWAFETGQFEKDYAEWMREQERGDAQRDARERALEVDDPQAEERLT